MLKLHVFAKAQLLLKVVLSILLILSFFICKAGFASLTSFYVIGIDSEITTSCGATQNVVFNITGTPDPVGTDEKLCVDLVVGLELVPNSETQISPDQGSFPNWDVTPEITTIGTGATQITRICYELPENYPSGELISLSLDVQTSSTAVCGPYTLSAFTEACTVTNPFDGSCVTVAPTSVVTPFAFNLIPPFEFNPGQLGLSVSCNEQGMLTADASVVFQNLGGDIPINEEIFIEFYYDENNDASHVGDELIHTIAYMGGASSGQFINLDGLMFNIPPDKLCPLIVRVQNGESCNCETLAINMSSYINAVDFFPSVSYCPGEPLQLGCGMSMDANFSWTSAMDPDLEYFDVSDPSMPVFTGPDFGDLHYLALIEINGCTFTDHILFSNNFIPPLSGELIAPLETCTSQEISVHSLFNDLGLDISQYDLNWAFDGATSTGDIDNAEGINLTYETEGEYTVQLELISPPWLGCGDTTRLSTTISVLDDNTIFDQISIEQSMYCSDTASLTYDLRSDCQFEYIKLFNNTLFEPVFHDEATMTCDYSGFIPLKGNLSFPTEFCIENIVDPATNQAIVEEPICFPVLDIDELEGNLETALMTLDLDSSDGSIGSDNIQMSIVDGNLLFSLSGVDYCDNKGLEMSVSAEVPVSLQQDICTDMSFLWNHESTNFPITYDKIMATYSDGVNTLASLEFVTFMANDLNDLTVQLEQLFNQYFADKGQWAATSFADFIHITLVSPKHNPLSTASVSFRKEGTFLEEVIVGEFYCHKDCAPAWMAFDDTGDNLYQNSIATLGIVEDSGELTQSVDLSEPLCFTIPDLAVANNWGYEIALFDGVTNQSVFKTEPGLFNYTINGTPEIDQNSGPVSGEYCFVLTGTLLEFYKDGALLSPGLNAGADGSLYELNISLFNADSPTNNRLTNIYNGHPCNVEITSDLHKVITRFEGIDNPASSFMNLAPGSYTLSAKDCCETWDTSFIIQNPPTDSGLAVTVAPENTSNCFSDDGKIKIEANSNAPIQQIVWKSDADSDTITYTDDRVSAVFTLPFLAMGEYEVWVYDACQDYYESVTIYSDDNLLTLTENIEAISECGLTDGSISISINTTFGVNSTHWTKDGQTVFLDNSGSINSQIENLSEGTYEVLVTTACGSRRESYVMEVPNPNALLTVSVESMAPENCDDNGSVTITADIDPTAIIDRIGILNNDQELITEITDGSESLSYDELNPGHYFVTIESGESCNYHSEPFVIDEYQIDLQFDNVMSGDIVCPSLSTTLMADFSLDSGDPYMVNWSGPLGLIQSNNPTNTLDSIEVSTPGQYRVDIVLPCDTISHIFDVELFECEDLVCDFALQPIATPRFICDSLVYDVLADYMVDISGFDLEQEVTQNISWIDATTGSVIDTDDIAAGLSPGNYQLVVDVLFDGEEGVLCSDYVNFTLDDIPVVELDIQSIVVDADCGLTNGSAQLISLDAVDLSQFAIMWMDQDGNVLSQMGDNVTDLGVGTYTVQFKDDNCVVAETIVHVNPTGVDPISVLSALPSVTCGDPNGKIVLLNIDPNTGQLLEHGMQDVDGNIVDSNDFPESNVFCDLMPGEYFVTSYPLGDDSCPFTQSVVVEAVENSLEVYPAVTPEGICGDMDGSISVIAIGGDLNYEIELLQNDVVVQSTSSIATGLGVFNGLTEGYYTLETTSNNGSCIDVQEVYVSRINVGISPDDFNIQAPLCAENPDASISFIGALPIGNSLELLDDSGTQLSVLDDPSQALNFENLAPGNYTINYNIDQAPANCTVDFDITIAEPDPIIVDLDFVSVPTICDGGSGELELLALGDTDLDILEFEWVDGDGNVLPMTGPVASGLDAGDYTVTPILLGCRAASIAMTIDTLMMPELPALSSLPFSCALGGGEIVLPLFDEDLGIGLSQIVYDSLGNVVELDTIDGLLVLDSLEIGTYTIETTSEDILGACPFVQEIVIEDSGEDLDITLEGIPTGVCGTDGMLVIPSVGIGGILEIDLYKDGVLLSTISGEGTEITEIPDLSPGEYVLEVSILDGLCTTSDTITIDSTGLDLGIEDIDVSVPSCLGGSDGGVDLNIGTLPIGDSINILDSDGNLAGSLDGDLNIGTLSSGEYVLEYNVGDPVLCTVEFPIEIPEGDSLQVDLDFVSVPTVCDGGSGELELLALGDTDLDILEFEWVDGDGNVLPMTGPVASGLDAGDYTVTPILLGCRAASIAMTIDTLMMPELPALSSLPFSCALGGGEIVLPLFDEDLGIGLSQIVYDSLGNVVELDTIDGLLVLDSLEIGTYTIETTSEDILGACPFVQEIVIEDSGEDLDITLEGIPTGVCGTDGMLIIPSVGIGGVLEIDLYKDGVLLSTISGEGTEIKEIPDLSPGEYVLEVSILDGLCTTSDTITIDSTGLDLGIEDIEVNVPSCLGASDGGVDLNIGTLPIGDAINILDSDGNLAGSLDGDLNIGTLSSGEYVLEYNVGDPVLCTVEFPIEIPEGDSLQVDLDFVSVPTVCDGGSGELELLALGDTDLDILEFEWVDGDGNVLPITGPVASGLDAGDYMVTPILLGCRAASIAMTIDTLMMPELPALSSLPFSCALGGGEIVLPLFDEDLGIGLSQIVYDSLGNVVELDTIDGLLVLDSLEIGTYTIETTSEDILGACPFVQEMVIEDSGEDLDITLEGIPTGVCDGDGSIVIPALGVEGLVDIEVYRNGDLWASANGDGVGVTEISDLQAGEYVVEISILDGLCMTSDTITIDSSELDIDTQDIDISAPSCLGASDGGLELNVPGLPVGDLVNITDLDGNIVGSLDDGLSINSLGSGEYLLEYNVGDPVLCTVEFPIEIPEGDSLQVDLDFVSVPTVCDGGSGELELLALGDTDLEVLEFEWVDGDGNVLPMTGPVASGLDAGEYTVTPILLTCRAASIDMTIDTLMMPEIEPIALVPSLSCADPGSGKIELPLVESDLDLKLTHQLVDSNGNAINGVDSLGAFVFCDLPAGNYSLETVSEDLLGACPFVQDIVIAEEEADLDMIIDSAPIDPCDSLGTMVVDAIGGNGLYNVNLLQAGVPLGLLTGDLSDDFLFENLEPGMYTVEVESFGGLCVVSQDVTIETIDNLIGLSDFEINFPECPGIDDGSITFNGSLDLGEVILVTEDNNLVGTFSTGINDVENLGPGVYTLSYEITEPTNCTIDLLVPIPEPEEIDFPLDLIAIPSGCSNPTGGAELTSPTGADLDIIEIVWRDQEGNVLPETLPNITSLPPGEYTAEPTINGCPLATIPFTVDSLQVQLVEILNVEPSTECGTNGGLALPQFDDQTGVTFVHTLIDADGNEITSEDGLFTDLGPGEYTIQSFDIDLLDACPYEQSLDIPAIPNNLIAVVEPLAASVCGDDGRIIVGATGGDGVFEINLWSNGNIVETQSADLVTLATFENLSVGLYTVEVLSDNGGCQYLEDVSIEQQDLGLSPDDFVVEPPSCSDINDARIGLPIVLPIPGIINVVRNDVDTTVVGSFDDSFDMNDLTSGSYTLEYLIDSDTLLCAISFDIEIPVVLPLITIPTQNILDNCPVPVGGLQVEVIGGTPDYTIDWIQPDTLEGFSTDYAGAGTYVYLVTDANGCESRDSFEILDTHIEIDPILFEPLIFCHGSPPDPILIAEDVIGEVLWFTGLEDQTGTYEAPEVSTDSVTQFLYYVAQEIDGCTSDKIPFQIFVDSLPAIIPHPDVNICEGDTLFLSGHVPDTDAVGYWTNFVHDIVYDLNISDIEVPDLFSGDYVFAWRVTDGVCTVTDTVLVEVIPECFFDIALDMELSPGQPTTVGPGDDVSYDIHVINEGFLPFAKVDIIDYVPDGMIYSPNDTNGWTDADADGNYETSFFTILLPGDTLTKNIVLQVDATANATAASDGSSRRTAQRVMMQSIDNEAEVKSTEDENGNPTADSDSTPNNASEGMMEDDNDMASVQVEPSTVGSELTLIKELSPNQTSVFNQGDDVSFDIRIENTGDVDAENVVLEELIPAGTSLSANDNNGWIYDANSDEYNLSLNGVVPARDFVIVNIVLTLNDDSDPNSLVNTASINNSQDPNHTDTAMIPVGGIILNKYTDHSEPIKAGDEIIFMMAISNNGNVPITNVEVTDYLSIAYTLSPDDNNGWSEDGNGNITNLYTGTIQPGTTEEIPLLLVITEEATMENATNSAAITAAENDEGEDIEIDEDDDPSEETPPVFDLTLEKYTQHDQPIRSGEDITFVIRVTNEGNTTANNVMVVDYLSEAYVLSANDTNGWSVDPDGNVVNTITDPIFPQTYIEVPILLEITEEADASNVNNTAEIAHAEDDEGNDRTDDDIDSDPDMDPENDMEPNDDPDNPHDPNDPMEMEDDTDDATPPVFDLSLDKFTYQTTPIKAGDEITYIIKVRNEGTVDAYDVMVTDYIPVGFVYSANNSNNWTIDGNGYAEYTFTGVLAAGDSSMVAIVLEVTENANGSNTFNCAEITEVKNEDGDDATNDDIDSTPDDDPDNDGDPDGSDEMEDDHDMAPPPIFDLALSKFTEHTTPVRPGDEVSFIVRVYNEGTVNASSIIVRDYIQEGFELSANDNNGWGLDPDGTASVKVEGPIMPSDSIDIPILLIVSADAEGENMFNDAEIEHAEDDNGVSMDDYDIDSNPDSDPDNEGDNEDDSDQASLPVFDLALIKYSENNNPVIPGDDVNFIIKVYNQGDITATNIMIADFIPSGLALSPNDSNGWTVDNNIATLTIPGPLVSGDSSLVSIVLQVQNGANMFNMINQAEIAHAEDEDGNDMSDYDIDSDPDMNPDDDRGGTAGSPDDDNTDGGNTGDEDDHDPAYSPVFDLALTKRIDAEESSSSQGSTVKYDIEICNQGTINASNVEVIDYLPTGMTFITSSLNQGWTLGADHTARYTYTGVIYAQECAEISLYLRVASSNTEDLVNMAEISMASDEDGNSADGRDIDSINDDTNDNDTGNTPFSSDDNDIDGNGRDGGDEDDHDQAFFPPCDAIACHGSINLSLNSSCATVIIPEMILSPAHLPADMYEVSVEDEHGNPHPNLFQADDIGQRFKVSVSVPLCDNNRCWGYVQIEDKFRPQIDCAPDVMVSCADLDNAPLPTVVENCGDAELILLDEQIETLDCDQDFVRVLRRTWQAMDSQGNTSETCTQNVFVERIDLNQVMFPDNRTESDGNALVCGADFALDANGNPDPSVTGVPTLLGNPAFPFEHTLSCNAYVVYNDEELPAFDCVQRIQRTWMAGEWWCNTATQRMMMQTIEIVDNQGPSITCPDNVTLSTNDLSCTAQITLPMVTVSDNCSDPLEVDVTYPGGFLDNQNGGDVTLDIGDNLITYTVYDDCDNSSSCSYTITIEDQNQPTTICLTNTVVSLTNSGQVDVLASAFDNGSYDDCAIHRFEARRMDDNCGHIDNTEFGESVRFCCADVGNEVMVIMRAYDQDDNFNQCMVIVEVQDKQPAQITCPGDITVDCMFAYDANDLGASFGNASLTDNCSGNQVIMEDMAEALNQCNVGTMARTFRVDDGQGQEVTCTQLITFEDPDPFDGNTDIIWPEDVTISSSCFDGMLDPENLPANAQFPTLIEDVCDMAGHSYIDDEFQFNQGSTACLKIIRHWKVTDWCGRQPDGTLPEFTYDQIIAVENNTDPVILNSCVDTTFCTFSADCSGGFVNLFLEASDDCTPADQLNYTYQLDEDNDGTIDETGSTSDASRIFEVGTHRITWSVEDGCGNVTSCIRTFEVVNCTTPVAICINGLSADLIPMDTNNDGEPDAEMVTINAEAFNGNSTQPCGNMVHVSFSADPQDNERTFDCDDLGDQLVQMWVTDEFGNQDFCETFIDIQDNNEVDICPDPEQMRVNVRGEISTEFSDMIDSVGVSLVGSESLTDSTRVDGKFAFDNMPLGGTYEVIPYKNDDPLNGVTTLDILLLQKHILGIDRLESPYKVIAADINKDGRVTGSDMSDLRKMVLGLYDEFPSNTSWRFIDAAHEFDSPETALEESFEEKYHIEPLMTDMLEVDFKGVKIGDLNESVEANAMVSQVEVRNDKNPLVLQFEISSSDEEGVITIPITSNNFRDIEGFQFTLKLFGKLLEVKEGALYLGSDNLGVVQNKGGTYVFSWISESATKVTVNPDEPLFYLVCQSSERHALNNLLHIGSDILSAEAYKANEILNISLEERIDSNLQPVSLFQNEPNPWSDKTTISFVIQKDSEVEIVFRDMTGKVLKRIKDYYLSGIHEVEINKEEIPMNGVIQYELITGEYHLTKRMVHIR